MSLYIIFKHTFYTYTYVYIHRRHDNDCIDGAALFYTSTLHPSTFDNLRHYIAHRSDPTLPSTIQPQHVESTCVFIPAGWDTWEKIKTLEESHLCKEVDTKQDDIIQNQSGGRVTKALLSIYREAIPEPGHGNQDPGLQPTVTSEDEQIFYARYFQQPSIVRSSLPPSLSTTFLRELKDWEASTSTFSSEDITEVIFFYFVIISNNVNIFR